MLDVWCVFVLCGFIFLVLATFSIIALNYDSHALQELQFPCTMTIKALIYCTII